MATSAQGALTITAAGTALGFSLSDFVTGFPNSGGIGPLGIAVNSAGKVVINSYYSGPSNLLFNNVDGQTVGDAIGSGAWNDGSYGSALTSLGSVTYGTHYSDNTTRIVNADGSQGAVVSNVGRGGIDADAARHSLLVATDAGIEEIDLNNANPATNHRLVASCGGFCFDGVTVSSNGATVYGEAFGHIYGYDIATGANVYDSGGIGSPDGVGVIRNGALAGQLITNNNEGRLLLLDTLTHGVTEIANGGSRGDYVGFDPSNGTLFLSQSDRVLRLTLAGGGIGGGGGGVPEPSAWALLLIGFGAMGRAMRARRKPSLRVSYT